MAPSDSNIPLATRQHVYRVLVDEFGFAADVPMAKVAAALMDAGIDKEAYGYAKLKAFLADLDDFLSFTDIVANGVPQRLVTIGKRDDWAAASAANAPDVRPTRTAPAVVPSKELERFAWLGPWDAFLSELAALALPESWDFDGPDQNGHRNAILKSYLCTTFYRLKLEDKVCIDEAARFAAFNTGLVTRRYDDIFACFEPGTGTIPWRFSGFCTSGSRGLGKRLVSLFNPLPEPASYFERMDDLLFDLEKELIIDYDHVLVDNMARLPLEFLEDELHGNDEACELLAEARSADPTRRATCFEEVGRIVEDDARLFRRLRSRLRDAVDMARKRARWNFKTAIPSYYPRANAMSLLLPLCLTDDDKVDAALVVQLMGSGNYQGQTILTMAQAYMNARLICRPDSDWLTPLSS